MPQAAGLREAAGTGAVQPARRRANRASPAGRTAPATGHRRRRGAPQTKPKQDAHTVKPAKRVGGVPQDPPETAGLLLADSNTLQIKIYSSLFCSTPSTLAPYLLAIGDLTPFCFEADGGGFWTA